MESLLTCGHLPVSVGAGYLRPAAYVHESLTSMRQVKPLSNEGEAMCYEPGGCFCEVLLQAGIGKLVYSSEGFTTQASVSILGGKEA